MPPRIQKLLEDIRDSAEFVLDQTSRVSADSYGQDRVMRQAVERNFEIIGEAVNRLRKLDPDIASRISHAQHRSSLSGNVLIHGYDFDR